MKQLAANSSMTYAVAYEPHEGWDSKFHKVKVTCERKGVKLEARQRYYALPDTRPGPQKAQAAMVAAYQRASDVAEIGLRASVSATTPNMAHVETNQPAEIAHIFLPSCSAPVRWAFAVTSVNVPSWLL